MKIVKISVVMSEFNTRETDFKASVESILNQTYRDFEFIIIDDSGKSIVTKLVESYKDKRIRVIDNKKNRGLIYSLNKGLREAKGKYIVRMDTDDVAMPDRLSKQLQFIEIHPEYSVVGTRALEFSHFSDTGILGKAGEKTKTNVSVGDTLIHPSVIMKRADIIKVGGYDDYYRAEDLSLWLKLLLAQKRLYVMEEVLLKYRVNSDDYNKRKLSARMGEISARLHYYPKLHVPAPAYLMIPKSIIAGILPAPLVRLYRSKFVLGKSAKYSGASQSKKPLVSIIVPIYNLENCIQETLDSIFNQTLQAFNLILINDGSTDDTSRILDIYSRKYKNITIINKSNGGVSTARNAGIEVVNTEYFMFVDGDDIVHPEYISTLLDTIQRTGAEVVTSLDAKNAKSMKVSNDESRVLTGMDACKQLLYGQSVKNSPFAKIYRTREFKNIRFCTDITVGEDLEYAFRCLRKSKNVVVTNHMLYAYIQRQGSAMNQSFNKKRADSYRVALKIHSGTTTTELEAAATAKLFVEALSVASLAHKYKSSYEKIYSDCLDTMKLYARRVLFNGDARTRHRFYAAFSIVNPNISIVLFNLKRNMVAMPNIRVTSNGK